MLIDLLKYHHSRWSNHLKVFMAFVGLIAAGITAIIKNSENLLLVQFLSLIGLVVCVFSIISINRIRNDEALKFSQVNRIEKKIKEYADSNDFLFITHSIEANSFFKGDEIDNKKFSPYFLLSINNLYIIVVIFSLFALYFIGGLTGFYFI